MKLFVMGCFFSERLVPRVAPELAPDFRAVAPRFAGSLFELAQRLAPGFLPDCTPRDPERGVPLLQTLFGRVIRDLLLALP